MRSITVTITFSPPDESFDRLTDEALRATIANGLLRAFPYLLGTELEVRSGPIVDSGDDGEADPSTHFDRDIDPYR